MARSETAAVGLASNTFRHALILPPFQGRRYLMIGGITLGCVGCVIKATAKTMDVAIVGAVI